MADQTKDITSNQSEQTGTTGTASVYTAPATNVTQQAPPAPPAQTPVAKGAYDFDDVKEYSPIIPNKDKEGNFVKCTNIEFKKVGNSDGKVGYDVLAFSFKEDGTTGEMTVSCFEPVPPTDLNNKEQVKLYKANQRKLMQFANSYSRDGGEIDMKNKGFNTFKQVCEYILTQIDPNYRNVPTKLKVVYNKKGNIDVGQAGNVISTTTRRREFEWDDAFDFVVKPAKASDSFGMKAPVGGGFAAPKPITQTGVTGTPQSTTPKPTGGNIYDL